MIRMNKEESDRMVLTILTEMSKFSDEKFAQESLQLIDKPYDNAVLTGILLNKAKPSVFNEEEVEIQKNIIVILTSFFCISKEFGCDLIEDGFSQKIINAFKFNEETIRNEDVYFYQIKNETKIIFAVSQFVSAFLEYERLENKYPNVMNLM